MSGLLHVEHVMGTAVTLDVRWPVEGCDAAERTSTAETAVVAAVQMLYDADRVFSTWLPDSDLSRLRRSEVTVQECHPWMALVLARCARAVELTSGWFDPWRMPGGIDPTGLVKGWAAQRASDVLTAAGVPHHAVNAGGDVFVHGCADVAAADRKAPGWRVGVTDPHRRSELLDVLDVRGGAVATSGSYERGSLAIDPHTGHPVSRLSAVTVTGPDLAVADALATAVTAAGPGALDWLSRVLNYEALIVPLEGDVVTTPGWWTRCAASR